MLATPCTPARHARPRRSRISSCGSPQAGLVYLVLLGGWIVLQKREPVATLSWLLGLALLPYLGFVIYYLLGPQRIHRQRLRRVARARGAAGAAGPRRPRRARVELARLAQATTGLPPTTRARRAHCWSTAQRSTTRCWRTSRGRATHVHLEYYIYQPDRTGTRAARRAGRTRARRGAGAPAAGRGGFGARRRGGSSRRCWRPAASSRGSIRCACGRVLAAAVAQPAHAPQDRGDRRPHRLHRRHQHHRRRRTSACGDDAYRDLHLRVEGRGRCARCSWCSSRTGPMPPGSRRSCRTCADRRRSRDRSPRRCWCPGRIRRGRRSTACTSPRSTARAGGCG